MKNKMFVSYLNSLHNYNAQNPNSYGEKNVGNEFFEKVMVKVRLCDFIVNKLNTEVPHVIILTGHAGDGKTSIMYQVLNELDVNFNPNEKIHDITLPNNKRCRCIKDFSELADNQKKEVLEEVVHLPKKDTFVFMVSNTGPLINTFGELFSDEETESAKIQLIEAMDDNEGSCRNIMGFDICVVNVAAVDNTFFATKFLEKVIDNELWKNCDECSKKEYCHILKNQFLIQKNKDKVFDFLNYHYIWLMEYGKRLTIRSMTEQLTYMITGGYNCEDVERIDLYKNLFSNLFFGFLGTRENKKALNIIAIREANKCSYYTKRFRSDEAFLSDYSDDKYMRIFSKDVAEIIKKAEQKNGYVSGWDELLKRTYIFMNINTDEEKVIYDLEDIFSKQFKNYISLRKGLSKPSKSDFNLICDALSMIFQGTITNEQVVQITLSRDTGITQNVQLVTGTIMRKNIKLITVKSQDSQYNNNDRYILKLMISDKILGCNINLPLFNYFEELKNGVISTSIDPQLSHGIESIKAEISALEEDDEDTFELIVLKNNGTDNIILSINDKNELVEA
ncbi:MAG: hypothetical protein J6A58_14650 [Oscillospiraceae bacterium]|nr:hypothetical protein [Oscillospiraceae bacterium]